MTNEQNSMVENTKKNYGGQGIQVITMSYRRQRIEAQYPLTSSRAAINQNTEIAAGQNITSLAPRRNQNIIQTNQYSTPREAENNTGCSCLKFFGVFISILALLASITTLIGSIFLSYDKNGKEVYISDGEEFTLTDLMKEVKANGPVEGIKTDYRGWFQRSHDSDSILNEYDSFFQVFYVGLLSGAVCIGYSVPAICSFAYNRKEGKLRVSFL